MRQRLLKTKEFGSVNSNNKTCPFPLYFYPHPMISCLVYSMSGGHLLGLVEPKGGP